MQQAALSTKPRLTLAARRFAAVRRGAPAVCRYKVNLRAPEGESVLEVHPRTYILDAADEAGLDLPYSCRSGGCSQCCSMLVSGAAPDQGEQSYLDDQQLAQGYVMLCVAYPTGDCVIDTHQYSNL